MQFRSQNHAESSDYCTDVSQIRIVKIDEVERETLTIKTLIFHDELCSKARPGQFIMVWIPRVDEVPMSLSMIGLKGLSGITVARVGEATAALHEKVRGGVIGIRGPYGNGFEPVDGKAMILGGGTGLAPLVPLAERLARRKTGVTFIVGAKTRDGLLFLDRIRSSLRTTEHDIIATTEDGSYGVKGFATDPVEWLLNEHKFDTIYTCGPETMMLKAFRIAEKHAVSIQASLERYMKCGVGLCGQCVLDPIGLRVCRDGPVFASEALRRISDFGKYRRDADGRKIPIE